nr:hypothetical protein CFP56_01758 [Quercus suber]
MDSILEGWNRFSLSDKEGDRVKLEKRSQPSVTNEVVLAAKFLNRRALNVDAIGRTFRSLWRTRKSFDIREVQLHGLPVDRLDIPTAIQIGKTVGMVSELEHESDMIGGDFMRVRVEVDISKPRCHGRIWGVDESKPFSAGRKTFCSVLGVEVFEQHHSRKEVTPEEPVGATTSPLSSSHTANNEDSMEGRGTNLGNPVLMKSFESQIEEIDLALNKYDTLTDSRMDTAGTKISLQLISNPLMDEVSINADECNPKISGNPNGTLATSDSITVPTGNHTPRKWKQLARLAHTDDSSMQSSSSRKRTESPRLANSMGIDFPEIRVSSLIKRSTQSWDDELLRGLFSPDLKLHVVRAVKNVISVKENLVKQKVLPDATCDHCKQQQKSVIHALWSCNCISGMWSSDQVWSSHRARTFLDFQRLVWYIIEADLDLELFSMIVWLLWYRPNQIRTGATTLPLNQVLTQAH